VQVDRDAVYWANYGTAAASYDDGGLVRVPTCGDACQAASCPAGLTSCAGACVDLGSSAHHCGACTNDCGPSGTCAGGACQKQPVPATLRRPLQLLADGKFVYWFDADGRIWRATPDLSDHRLIGQDGVDDDLAMDGQALYWSNQSNPGQVHQLLKADGARDFLMTPYEDFPGAPVSDGATVFFQVHGEQPQRHFEFHTCGVNGCNFLTTPLVTFPASLDSFTRFHSAVDANWLYLAAANNGGFITRVSKTAPTVSPAPIIANLGWIQDLVVDGQNIYWVDPDGSIGRAASDGSGVTKLSPPAPNVAHLAVDPAGTPDASVYWASPDQGTVYRCAVVGCGMAPIVVASGQTNPRGVAVDASWIYWGNQGTAAAGYADGSIAKAPR
jgi:hypothetical protein